MIWSDSQLRNASKHERLVEPYDPACINPASQDLKLGNQIREPHPVWSQMTAEQMREAIADGTIDLLPRWGEAREFDTYWLMPGAFVLCASLEFVRIPEDATALLFSKSSTGRVGLEHLHAGLGDPGFAGQWTWELINVAPWPIKLEAGKRVMQQVLIRMAEPPEASYQVTGRYNNQTGPTEARPEKQ